ncbi:CoA transferase [Achromobacter sp. GG226]|uniref:CaiB/BaiF CoA transferase family protein n=1 Tax=Verticiella alkaliphila TaxID=2779529 RepID=UPI001C0C6D0D|nr:CoA transferase [Verticiella sp. GG226]MBU4611491.1 CoA transferase [Verticiella sp. GG226]
MIGDALQGIRVIDLSRILAGPWCAQNLADLGAEVIKIERPASGDDTRSWGPPYVESEDGTATMSAYFSCCNRNKKSVTLDFKAPADRERLLALIATADVVVENYRVGTLAQYGLDHATLRARHPGLVYASITGYGQSGPKASRPGYDYIFQGLGGLMSYTGRADDEPGAGPLRAGVAVVDVTTGMYATSAILAALLRRTRTGEGAYIDLALLDVAVALNANQGANYLVSGDSPRRTGNAHPNLAPYEVFAAADGYFILAVGNDVQFAKLCTLCELPALAEDPRFCTNPARVAHLAELRPLLAAALIRRPRDAWTAALDALGVSWGAVNTVSEVFDDPQVRHRGMLQHATHPLLGRIPLVRNPMLAGEPPAGEPAPPPLLGEHNHHYL